MRGESGAGKGFLRGLVFDSSHRSQFSWTSVLSVEDHLHRFMVDVRA